MVNPGKIAVVGAGFMGCVIATLYARHGYPTVLHDRQGDMLATFRERALPIAKSLATADRPAQQILDGVRLEADLEQALAGAMMVHEVVQEVLSTKQELFCLLDRLCPPEVLLATNTSSFMLTEICRDVVHRDRVLGIHYVTPAHIIPVVEIIRTDATSVRWIEWARRFLETLDHVGVVCSERPGFLLNRIQFALLSEVYRIVDEGLASREDVDTAMRLSFAPRLALWGPLLTEDLVVNKRTALAVTQYLHDQTGEEKFKPVSALKELVEQGKLGAISGEGWYRWDAPYDVIIEERDRQLSEILDWLQRKSAPSKIGVARV